ncbi:hypothetical protein [Streptantibioticus ferralitis]|uniref:Uncharacterized protein n=1 Tax=Streptantibioticus ferralitis TaxID=236510 RepID=A0ABT5YY37_9ACTN|nr:hypothetical protein [Streptantibioticus ferralitis]
MNPRERRAARHQPPNPEVEADPGPRRRKAPITVEQVIDTALGVIATEGQEALTMRRPAARSTPDPPRSTPTWSTRPTSTSCSSGGCAPSSYYPSPSPEPDPAARREQIRGVCTPNGGSNEREVGKFS